LKDTPIVLVGVGIDVFFTFDIGLILIRSSLEFGNPVFMLALELMIPLVSNHQEPDHIEQLTDNRIPVLAHVFSFNERRRPFYYRIKTPEEFREPSLFDYSNQPPSNGALPHEMDD
jgi:hypothetical protein